MNNGRLNQRIDSIVDVIHKLKQILHIRLCLSMSRRRKNDCPHTVHDKVILLLIFPDTRLLFRRKNTRHHNSMKFQHQFVGKSTRTQVVRSVKNCIGMVTVFNDSFVLCRLRYPYIILKDIRNCRFRPFDQHRRNCFLIAKHRNQNPVKLITGNFSLEYTKQFRGFKQFIDKIIRIIIIFSFI